MPKPENKFTTISDMQKVLADIAGAGFGDLPVQILVVPDSTLQALARHAGATADDKPALMMEFAAFEGRVPVSIVSTERLGDDQPRAGVQ